MPASSALFTSSSASAEPTFETEAKMPGLEPKVIAPNARRETIKPVSPIRVYCMVSVSQSYDEGMDSVATTTAEASSSSPVIDLEKKYLLQNYARYPLVLTRGKGCYV